MRSVSEVEDLLCVYIRSCSNIIDERIAFDCDAALIAASAAVRRICVLESRFADVGLVHPDLLETVKSSSTLYLRLCQTGVKLTGAKPPTIDKAAQDWRARLERFASFYKLNDAPGFDSESLLRSYRGREVELIRALSLRFGPEPPESPVDVPLAVRSEEVTTVAKLQHLLSKCTSGPQFEQITQILQHVDAGEELLRNLVAEYETRLGIDDQYWQSLCSPVADEQSPRAETSWLLRVQNLLSHHAPAELPSAESYLSVYAGREDALMGALVARLGPEPPFTSPLSAFEVVNQGDSANDDVFPRPPEMSILREIFHFVEANVFDAGEDVGDSVRSHLTAFNDDAEELLSSLRRFFPDDVSFPTAPPASPRRGSAHEVTNGLFVHVWKSPFECLRFALMMEQCGRVAEALGAPFSFRTPQMQTFPFGPDGSTLVSVIEKVPLCLECVDVVGNGTDQLWLDLWSKNESRVRAAMRSRIIDVGLRNRLLVLLPSTAIVLCAHDGMVYVLPNSSKLSPIRQGRDEHLFNWRGTYDQLLLTLDRSRRSFGEGDLRDFPAVLSADELNAGCDMDPLLLYSCISAAARRAVSPVGSDRDQVALALLLSKIRGVPVAADCSDAVVLDALVRLHNSATFCATMSRFPEALAAFVHLLSRYGSAQRRSSTSVVAAVCCAVSCLSFSNEGNSRSELATAVRSFAVSNLGVADELTMTFDAMLHDSTRRWVVHELLPHASTMSGCQFPLAAAAWRYRREIARRHLVTHADSHLSRQRAAAELASVVRVCHLRSNLWRLQRCCFVELYRRHQLALTCFAAARRIDFEGRHSIAAVRISIEERQIWNQLDELHQRATITMVTEPNDRWALLMSFLDQQRCVLTTSDEEHFRQRIAEEQLWRAAQCSKSEVEAMQSIERRCSYVSVVDVTRCAITASEARRRAEIAMLHARELSAADEREQRRVLLVAAYHHVRFEIEREAASEFAAIALNEATAEHHSSLFCVEQLEAFERSVLAITAIDAAMHWLPQVEEMIRWDLADAAFEEHDGFCVALQRIMIEDQLRTELAVAFRQVVEHPLLGMVVDLELSTRSETLAAETVEWSNLCAMQMSELHATMWRDEVFNAQIARFASLCLVALGKIGSTLLREMLEIHCYGIQPAATPSLQLVVLTGERPSSSSALDQLISIVTPRPVVQSGSISGGSRPLVFVYHELQLTAHFFEVEVMHRHLVEDERIAGLCQIAQRVEEVVRLQEVVSVEAEDWVFLKFKIADAICDARGGGDMFRRLRLRFEQPDECEAAELIARRHHQRHESSDFCAISALWKRVTEETTRQELQRQVAETDTELELLSQAAAHEHQREAKLLGAIAVALRVASKRGPKTNREDAPLAAAPGVAAIAAVTRFTPLLSLPATLPLPIRLALNHVCKEETAFRKAIIAEEHSALNALAESRTPNHNERSRASDAPVTSLIRSSRFASQSKFVPPSSSRRARRMSSSPHRTRHATLAAIIGRLEVDGEPKHRARIEATWRREVEELHWALLVTSQLATAATSSSKKRSLNDRELLGADPIVDVASAPAFLSSDEDVDTKRRADQARRDAVARQAEQRRIAGIVSEVQRSESLGRSVIEADFRRFLVTAATALVDERLLARLLRPKASRSPSNFRHTDAAAAAVVLPPLRRRSAPQAGGNPVVVGEEEAARVQIQTEHMEFMHAALAAFLRGPGLQPIRGTSLQTTLNIAGRSRRLRVLVGPSVTDVARDAMVAVDADETREREAITAAWAQEHASICTRASITGALVHRAPQQLRTLTDLTRRAVAAAMAKPRWGFKGSLNK